MQGLVSHVSERQGATFRQNRAVQDAFLTALKAQVNRILFKTFDVKYYHFVRQLSEAEQGNVGNDFGGTPKIVGVCAALVMFANLASHMPDKRQGVLESILGLGL